MVNFHFCFVFKHIFIGSLPNSSHVFTLVFSCHLYIQLSHNIYIITRNHTNLYKFMIFETKKKVVKKKEERESPMNRIKITPSQLFPHVKCNNIFSFLLFALICTPLLTIFWTMSTYTREVKLFNTCSYVNDMIC